LTAIDVNGLLHARRYGGRITILSRPCRMVEAAVARGELWQLAIDSLRPHATGLWQALSPEDRARFVRTLRPYWDVLRHRAPADALAIVEEWRARRAAQLAKQVLG
jgi:uncharacterized NAD(P)/FAD-binding protein YdhS